MYKGRNDYALLALAIALLATVFALIHVDNKANEYIARQRDIEQRMVKWESMERCRAEQFESVYDAASKLAAETNEIAVKLSSNYTEGTETPLNFDFEGLCRIITAEGGHDYTVCHAVATACYNAYNSLGGELDPAEVCKEYQYAAPATFITDEARGACKAVFVDGQRCNEIGKSTIFYNPLYGWSNYHESQRFVVELNGVRFFEEVG